LLRTWQDVTPGDGPSILTSVTFDEADRLAALAAGRDVLEIGSARGYSAVVMALAGGRVVAIDDHSGATWLGDTYAAMTRNLAAYGVTADIIRGLSQEVMPSLAAAGRKFGLVFIDGDHGYHSVLHDALWAIRLTAPGGTIACHDYREDNCPGVAQALDELFPAGPSKLTGTLFEMTP
jgi:predicted O-methyltransferase YrrM